MNDASPHGGKREEPANSIHSPSACKNRINKSCARNLHNLVSGASSRASAFSFVVRSASVKEMPVAVSEMGLPLHTAAATMSSTSKVLPVFRRATPASTPGRQDELFLVEIYA